MARDTLDTNPPPPLPAPEGFEYFMPELYYFRDTAEVEVREATRITALCLAHWCRAYRVQAVEHAPLDGPRIYWPGREDEFPPEEADRRDAMKELLDWLDRSRGAVYSPITLIACGVHIMTGELFPFLLTLRADQFRQLQDCWASHGLPRDLCYPASEQRETVEAVTIGDETLQMRQRYTPRRWQLRETVVADSHSLSERDRNIRFAADCGRFLRALARREMELREVHDSKGETEDSGVDLLRKAGVAVSAVIIDARKRLQADGSQR